MAIQQHPLPQDISSYRFRLIGDMTIKQFASLGISIVLAIITYSLPLPFFFKYPLSFILLCLGVGMAFVPVQGRSLDVWILAFIKSIYSPTQYSWKRSEEVTADTIIPTGQNHAVQAQTNAPIEITKGLTPSAPTPAIIPQIPEESKPEPEIPEAKLLEIVPVTPSVPASPRPEEIPSAPTSPPTVTPPAPQTPTPTGLPIPFTPGTPNTLVGLTLNTEGKILDGVMVEIQKNGLTSRATKSNKLGQFMFARPLENGTYQIIAEKDNFAFSPYSLELTGEIIRPLKIQSQ